MKHEEGQCWCKESHLAAVLPCINGEDAEPQPPVKQITITDPHGLYPERAKHEVRFTTVYDEHSAASTVEYLTDAELTSLYFAAVWRRAG